MDYNIEEAYRYYCICKKQEHHRNKIINEWWQTASGRLIAVRDMSTQHILNVIKMLRRQVDGSAHDDFVYDNIDMMERELKRRSSTWTKSKT